MICLCLSKINLFAAQAGGETQNERKKNNLHTYIHFYLLNGIMTQNLRYNIEQNFDLSFPQLKSGSGICVLI